MQISAPVWVIILTILAGLTGLHILLHYAIHGVANLHQIAMAAFLVLNLLINFWEIGLYFTGDEIRKEYLDNKHRFEGKPMAPAAEFFKRRIPLNQIFTFRHWTGVWASYCYFDSGYSRRGSFGYNIDVGNGFSTVLPATVFALGMTLEWLPAKVLGIIGVAMFWQMFYGTVVYFFQFFHAGRHQGHKVLDLCLFVGASNGMWFVFPIWGLWLSVWLIFHDSYRIFNTASPFWW
ncbi:MAG: hypothetical protein R3208_16620 [Ketobacteraceae bacterium]|nr:hypothetical protein [Ketobacteraceae bacterium]